MHKILQNHLLCAFVANLKIDALYPESFCNKNLAIRKVFAFCDSATVQLFSFCFERIFNIFLEEDKTFGNYKILSEVLTHSMLTPGWGKMSGYLCWFLTK